VIARVGLKKMLLYGSKRLELPYDTLSVEELVGMGVKGDAEAFRELYRRYRSVLFARARRLLDHLEDAEDVLQDTFMEAWEKLPGCKHPDRFPHWLHGILRNKTQEAIRKRKKRKIVEEKVVHSDVFLHIYSGKVPEPGEEDWQFIFALLERTVPKLAGKKVKLVVEFMFKHYRESGDFPSVRNIEKRFGLTHGTAQRWREHVIEICRRVASAHGFSLDV